MTESALKTLGDALGSSLRESAFENRYSLHPRRLLEIGQELAGSFLGFIEKDPAADPSGVGQKLAREGLGERTILLLSTRLRNQESLTAADAFIEALLAGFMKSREQQILTDQEQLRHALSAALESQSQELFIKNHAINTSINGIVLADLDGKITWVNSAFLQMWGYASAAEAIGAPMGDIWVGEKARDIVQLLPRSGGWRGELVARRKDGVVFSVELSASVVRNEESRAIGLMSSVVDITERKRLQAQILQVQKMDALGMLAGGIAHDFNNLLTAINGYMELLLIEAPRDTVMYEDLIQVRAAVDRGAALTRQLRLFTRQSPGTRQTVSLNNIARETWQLIKRTFPPKIAIELSFSPDAVNIEADPNQMSQVLVNLCLNARDAMMERAEGIAGGTLTIGTSVVELTEKEAAKYVSGRPGKYVVLSVRDTGVVMPPEMLERLFIPFVTTKAVRSGTGLGLAVVYGIVASHNGFIEVTSVPGKGSTFELFLPLSERSEQTDGTSPQGASEQGFSRGHGTILVVDDDPQVRQVITRMLESCGYAVVTARDGREGLARFGNGIGIDLVVLDLVMPGMGGKECLRLLREASPQARVLITTGHVIDSSAQELLREGALGLVEKPHSLQALISAVQNALGRAD